MARCFYETIPYLKLKTNINNYNRVHEYAGHMKANLRMLKLDSSDGTQFSWMVEWKWCFSHIRDEFLSDFIVYIGTGSEVQRAINPCPRGRAAKLSSATPVSSIEWLDALCWESAWNRAMSAARPDLYVGQLLLHTYLSTFTRRIRFCFSMCHNRRAKGNKAKCFVLQVGSILSFCKKKIKIGGEYKWYEHRSNVQF